MHSWKRYLFWAVTAAVLLLVVAYDQSALYLYLPRAIAVAVVLVLFCPALYFLAADKRLAYGAMVLVAASPYLVAPFAATQLKRFYRDCAAIESGDTAAQVEHRMQGYSTSLKRWGATQPASITEHSPKESGRTPYIYTPSPELDADFCMVYLADGVVDRVVLAPD